MNSEGVKLQVEERWKLYKWDASIVGDQPPDPTKIDASQHPGCLEIWEMPPGGPAQLIYQRSS